MLLKHPDGKSWTLLTAVVVLCALLGPFLLTDALAQQRVERRNLLDILFGSGRTQRMQPAPRDDAPDDRRGYGLDDGRNARPPERIIRRRPAVRPPPASPANRSHSVRVRSDGTEPVAPASPLPM